MRSGPSRDKSFCISRLVEGWRKDESVKIVDIDVI